jgi:hypothetical protein
MPTPSEQQEALYRPAFAHNCLLLIVRAYQAMETRSLQNAEEPDITGLLVKSAKEIIEKEDAEAWLEHLEVIDDPPQNDLPERLGKTRHRIDIEFVRTGRGKRPRFHVEAKRLYRSDSVSEYFGTGGLEMFLNGKYASQWPSAGMVGYVQSDNQDAWVDKLAVGFMSRKNALNVCTDESRWRTVTWSALGMTNLRESCHQRNGTLGKIGIYHLLLEFLRVP